MSSECLEVPQQAITTPGIYNITAVTWNISQLLILYICI